MNFSLNGTLPLLALLVAGAAVAPGLATAKDRKPVEFESAAGEQASIQVPPLLGPQDLSRLLEVADPYIVDIRNPKARLARFSYGRGHLPGSVNVPYGDWRKLWSDPLAVPTDAELTAFVQSNGMSKDRPIVIVHSSAAKGNFGSAAFVYWILKSAGFTNMAILNGGIGGWKDINGEITKEVPTIVRSNEVVSLDDTWLATHEDVDAVLDGTSDAQLLDARPIKQIMKDASLDGAFLLNGEDLVSGEGGAATSDESIFLKIKQADLDWQYTDVITYCSNGALAAIDWFMASEIGGIPNVRVYAHSLKARAEAEKLREKAATN